MYDMCSPSFPHLPSYSFMRNLKAVCLIPPSDTPPSPLFMCGSSISPHIPIHAPLKGYLPGVRSAMCDSHPTPSPAPPSHFCAHLPRLLGGPGEGLRSVMSGSALWETVRTHMPNQHEDSEAASLKETWKRLAERGKMIYAHVRLHGVCVGGIRAIKMAACHIGMWV